MGQYLPLPEVARLWFSELDTAVEVESLWYGSDLIFGPGISAPTAFGAGDWSVEMEPAGPFGANTYVQALTTDPAAVQWTQAADPLEEADWLPTIQVGGRWLLTDATGEDIFPAGTYSNIRLRWRSGTNPLWSLESTDTKGFDFTDYVINAVVESIEVELIPGVQTSFDASIAFSQDPTWPDWPKVYWVAIGAHLLPPHRWEGSVMLVDTPADWPAGTVTVTLDAAFSQYAPDLPAPVALGAGAWEIEQQTGVQTYDAAALFSGAGMGFTIFEITGATGSATFGVADGLGGYQQFTTPTGPLEVVGGPLNVTLNALTGELSADTNGLIPMSGVTITIRATNYGGFADEDIAFTVLSAGFGVGSWQIGTSFVVGPRGVGVAAVGTTLEVA